MSDTAVGSQDEISAGGGQQDAARSTLSPGAQLALLRQERGMTTEEVATQLNLASRQIQAIEADNYAALPGMASVRGFIRGYAKILKLDPAPLLAKIANETAHLTEPFPPRPALSEPFSDNRLVSAGKKGSWPSAAFIIVLVLLVIGAFVGQQMGWIHAFPEAFSTKLTEISETSTAPSNGTLVTATAITPIVSPSGETAPRPVADAATDSASVPAQVLAIAPASSDSAPGIVPASRAPIALSRDVVATVQEQRGGNVAPAAQSSSLPVIENPAMASRNALIVKPREDSWIEIVRANHTTVMSRLVKGGTVEAVEVTEPVSLTVGNAAAVDVTLRGVPVDLKGSTKSNVARVTLR